MRSSGVAWAVILMALEWGAHGTIIDLSHTLSNTTIYWPGLPSFNWTQVMAMSNQNNIWIEVGAFSSGEHGGTHIDVPRHFNQTGYDLNDLPIELTIADGVMIDVKNEAARNSDYALTVQKILDWEAEHGQIPVRAAVVINTGWTSRWPNPSRFFNSNNITDPATFHFPIVSREAAQWLVSNRNLKMLGLDVPGPDGPRDTTFPVHLMLLSRNILILENMMIPDSLPSRGFRLHAAPIRVKGGTGTPTRMYAMLYDKNEACFGRPNFAFIVRLFIIVAVFARSTFS